MKNVIDEYLNYRQKHIKKICMLLSDVSPIVINNYINVYIDFMYCHRTYTLDNCEIFDFSNLNKELQGKYHEVVYEQKTNQLEATKCFYVCFLAFMLENENFKTIEELEKHIKRIKKTNPNMNFINPNLVEIFKEIETFNQTITEYIKMLNDERFSLIYNELENNHYYLNLGYILPKLNKFKKAVVNTTFNSKKLSYGKTLTILNLLSYDIVASIPYKEKMSIYFIDYPIYEGQKGNDLYDAANHELSPNLVLVIDIKDYNKNKTVVGTLRNVFKLAVKVNLDKVPNRIDYLKKLDTITLFDYIIIEDINNKHEKELKDYKSETGKTIYIGGE